MSAGFVEVVGRSQLLLGGVSFVFCEWEERRAYPIENFFSALAIVWSRILAALSVRVLACMSCIPHGLGDVDGEGGRREEVGEDGRDETGGQADESLGEVGRLGHWVREREAVEDAEVIELAELAEREEALLEERVKDAPLKTERAGELADCLEGERGEVADGSSMSLRTTMRERCNRLRPSLLET